MTEDNRARAAKLTFLITLPFCLQIPISSSDAERPFVRYLQWDDRSLRPVEFVVLGSYNQHTFLSSFVYFLSAPFYPLTILGSTSPDLPVKVTLGLASLQHLRSSGQSFFQQRVTDGEQTAPTPQKFSQRSQWSWLVFHKGLVVSLGRDCFCGTG